MHAAISRIWGIYPHLAATGVNCGRLSLICPPLLVLLPALSGIRTSGGPRKRSLSTQRTVQTGTLPSRSNALTAPTFARLMPP